MLLSPQVPYTNTVAELPQLLFISHFITPVALYSSCNTSNLRHKLYVLAFNLRERCPGRRALLDCRSPQQEIRRHPLRSRVEAAYSGGIPVKNQAGTHSAPPCTTSKDCRPHTSNVRRL